MRHSRHSSLPQRRRRQSQHSALRHLRVCPVGEFRHLRRHLHLRRLSHLRPARARRRAPRTTGKRRPDWSNSAVSVSPRSAVVAVHSQSWFTSTAILPVCCLATAPHETPVPRSPSRAPASLGSCLLRAHAPFANAAWRPHLRRCPHPRRPHHPSTQGSRLRWPARAPRRHLRPRTRIGLVGVPLVPLRCCALACP